MSGTGAGRLTTIHERSWRSVDRAEKAWPYLVVLVLIAQSVLDRVDGALASRHRVGAVSGGVGDIATPGSLAEPEVPAQVVTGWVDPGRLLWTYLAVDVVLMVLVAALLLVLRRRMLKALGKTSPQGSSDRAVVGALWWSWLPALIYLVTDGGETGTAVLVATTGSFASSTAMFVGFMSLLKWVALALALLPHLLALLALPTRRRALLAGLDALRGHVLVVGLLTVLFLMLQGDIGRQIDDVVVHAAENVAPALAATGLAWALSSVMVVGGLRCLAAYQAPPAITAVSDALLRGAGVLGAALLIGAFAAWQLGPDAYRGTALALLVVPGAAVLLWWLLSLPRQVREVGTTPEPPSSKPAMCASSDTSTERPTGWLHALAVVPPILLTLAVVRATVTSHTLTEEAPLGPMIWTAVLCLLLLVAGAALRGAAGRPSATPIVRAQAAAGRAEATGWVVASAVGLAVMAGSASSTLWTAVGTLGVLLVSALVLLVGLVGLTLLGDSLAPRGALALTGLRRMPLISMLVLWGVLASAADREGRYYDARLLAGPGTESSWLPVSPGLALSRWAEAGHPSDPAEARSLIFVTASGGGVRAAYWTQLVWECSFGTSCGAAEGLNADRSTDVFMASGVSGGAVGLSIVLGGDAPAVGRDEVLDQDFLAPALAAAVSRDLPNSVLRLPWSGNDRAATLADAVTRAATGLGKGFGTYASHPHLAMSGTSVEDGCRLTLSTIRQDSRWTRCQGSVTEVPSGGPGPSPVRRGQDYLCDRDHRRSDLTLADAAFLSARFPYVSPAASLPGCTRARGTTYVLDGGMYDNSGASSVSNVLDALAPHLDARNRRASAVGGETITTVQESGEPGTWRGCVIPRLLVIENQFSSIARSPETQRPLQTLGPAQTLLSFYGDRSDRELALAARKVQRAADRAHRLCSIDAVGPSVVVVHPVRAGGAAAPLGWTLSEQTRDLMARQAQVVCADPEKPIGRSTPTKAEASPAPDGTPDQEEDVLHQHGLETCSDRAAVHAWLGQP